jgi:alpha-beta hydrolase superfamily lysophospholipase
MRTEGQLTGLFYTLFEPDKQPVKASLLLLHGMAEHHQRYAEYAEFAQYLPTLGFTMLAYDQLGHGQTAKNNADASFFQLTFWATLAYVLTRPIAEVPYLLVGDG